MAWVLKSVFMITPDLANITLSFALPNGKEDTVLLQHHRTSFAGRPQSNKEWGANIQREITANLTALNAAPATGPQDVTASFGGYP